MAGIRMENKIYEVGMYCRLSKDDGTDNESASIATQKSILTDYVKKQGWHLAKTYVDDGYSGTNFQRPSFQNMIKDIESGLINCVITKDLSRLGRNYLDCGLYLEVFFPEHNVRYIAVNDGVDTLNKSAMDITPFRNILNEMYSADVSVKIKSAYRARFQQGKFMGTTAPYGYVKDPADHNHLLIDDKVAHVVREIFDLALAGNGIAKIRKHINKQHILRPAAYAAEQGATGYERYFEENEENRYIWSENSVRGILRSPIYAGNLAGYKRIAANMKSKKRPSKLPEEWEVIPDTHEGIVTQEEFDTVQQLMTSRRREQNAGGFENIFSGVIKCADCGYAMRAASANRRKRPDIIDCVQYTCNNYGRYGNVMCTAHSIEARDLFNAVLADINRFADMAVNDEKAVRAIERRLTETDQSRAKSLEKEKKKLNKRLAELDRLFSSLYEDKVMERITERNFEMMSGKYQKEQLEIEARLKEVTETLNDSYEKSQGVRDFLSLIRNYQGLKELDATIINALIDKILVSEREKLADGTVRQEIKIYYKFIGFVGELHITPTKRWTALKPKNCTVCGVEYVPSSGISKYCPACAKRIQREKSNESKRRSRERNRRACIELSAKNDRLIWGNWSEKANTYSATDAVPDPNNKRCFVANLRKVEGTKAIGGFAGQIDPASAANLDTASSEGLLGGLLQYLIGTPGDLARLLDATISTVRGADVKAWDDWGIIVNGSYTNDSDHTAYAKAAGGFAGEINGAVIGKQDDPNSGLHVVNIRSVTGGEYAGGFLGLADVSAILQVSNGNTSILSALLTLGGTSVLDTFRSYVYHSDVSGSAEAGLEVQARDSKKSEYVNDPVYSGSAGGFGGALLNGSVKDSKVTNLRKVNGMNYTGGFIGHLGKSGTVDLDNLGALGDLLSAGAGVMDVFGSHVDRCSVEGVNEGFTVHSNNTIDQKNKSEIAGGFTGYADLGRLSENKVTGLKQVTSGQIAGGFAGKTTFAYLANINLDSELVKGLVTVVNQILKALWLDELQKGQVIKIDLGIIEIDALYDGKLVSLNLLGLDIKVGLAEDKSLATIYIGDSKIEINCSESGTIDEESLKNEINISLIKANRTKIDKCTVTGIADGYDVYGGGAGNNANGTGQYGIAGGFVGWNNEGLLENNNMFFADVIRGAKDLTGPFTGKSSLNSNWEFNDVKGIEGNENYYRIYRNGDTAYEKLFGKSGKELQHNYETSDAWKNVYTIRHMTKDKVVKFTDLKDAMMSGSAGQIPVNVYQEDGAMAVLMNNTASSPTEPGGNEEAPDVQDPCKDLIELRLKKVWKRDEEKDRPNEVIFNITRSYEKDGKPVVDTNFNKEVILTKKDAQTSDIWEKVLTGAEYTAYHVGTDGKKYYYTYHVSEMKVDGYTTEITYKGDRQYSITVTNTKNWFDSLLPETGGMGKALLYTLGVLLLCLVTATEYRKRKSTRSQSSYK